MSESRLAYFTRKLWEVRGIPAIVKDTISALTAVVSDKTVSKERITSRVTICASCPYVSIDGSNNLLCSICNCKVTEKDYLLNLALYEEDTSTPKMWGCKHPEGSQWKKEGV